MTKLDDIPACTTIGLDLWYPDKGRGDYVRMAKMVCKRCPIQPACLEGALERDEQFGVWGGMTNRERRAELRRRMEREAA